MQDVRQTQNFKWWPTLQEYNEAIQMPMNSLEDPELKKGLPYTNALGLPRAVTGSFATVYRINCADKDFALRLFLRNILDQAERYALIADFFKHDTLRYAATFEFLKNGIKPKSDWLPALKMEWIDGKSFDEYIVENIDNSSKLGELANSFVDMMNSLRVAGIAHGDLQHGNIIMCSEKIRLVDLDGMFVPGMENYKATELGHPNYQHPGRAEHHFGAYLDNFSAWIIYASIKGLQHDPKLLNQLGGGDDCLLFRRSDFSDPLNSAAFASFEKHRNDELKQLGRFIRLQLAKDLHDVPYLQLPVPFEDGALIAIDETVSIIKSGPRLVRHETADWLKKENITELVKSKLSSSVPQNVIQTGQQSWAVQVRTPQRSEWFKPSAGDFAATARANLEMGRLKNLVPYLPPELCLPDVPRAVKFNKKLNKRSPELSQWLMIFNPFVWLMFYFLVTAFTTDEQLRTEGFWYPATVTNVNRYETFDRKNKIEHTDIDLQFNAGGKTFVVSKSYGQDWGTYKIGDKYNVRALSSDPNVHEPFGERIGYKQELDRYLGCLSLLVNLLIECSIWLRSLWHKRLAKLGIPVVADVVALWSKKAGSDAFVQGVTFSYYMSNRLYTSYVEIKDKVHYKSLKEGTKETLLCDPMFPRQFVVYQFCQYHPILKTSVRKLKP